MYFTLKYPTLKSMSIVVAIQVHFFQRDFISVLLRSSSLSVPLLSIFDIPFEAKEQIFKRLF